MKFPIFPKFKKVQNIIGEGGDQENGGLFPLFVIFFDSGVSLSSLLCLTVPLDTMQYYGSWSLFRQTLLKLGQHNVCILSEIVSLNGPYVSLLGP